MAEKVRRFLERGRKAARIGALLSLPLAPVGAVPMAGGNAATAGEFRTSGVGAHAVGCVEIINAPGTPHASIHIVSRSEASAIPLQPDQTLVLKTRKDQVAVATGFNPNTYVVMWRTNDPNRQAHAVPGSAFVVGMGQNQDVSLSASRPMQVSAECLPGNNPSGLVALFAKQVGFRDTSGISPTKPITKFSIYDQQGGSRRS